MIKTILDFLQVHWEMVLRDAAILIQNMFRITPKAFNTIDIILPPPGHQIYPYRLRHLAAVTRPNHVWAMDITYVPMARGFVYLVAVGDWFSRKVLAWRLSITLETGPCVEAFRDALARHGPPENMNTDQGSQFTSVAFLTALQEV